MSKWFYFNQKEEKIEVTGAQLKVLARKGIISPETIVETEDGRFGRAGKVTGLVFENLELGENLEPENIPKPTKRKKRKRFTAAQMMEMVEKVNNTLNNEWTIRIVCIVGLVILLPLGVWAFVNTQSDSDSPSLWSSFFRETVAVSVETLINDYRSGNTFAADKKYKNKYVEVTGIVTYVGEQSGFNLRTMKETRPYSCAILNVRTMPRYDEIVEQAMVDVTAGIDDATNAALAASDKGDLRGTLDAYNAAAASTAAAMNSATNAILDNAAGVECKFLSRNKDQLSSLFPGSKVTIKGICRGERLGGVVLDNCVVIKR